LAELKTRQESSSSTITRKYQESVSTIEDLQRQLRTRSETIGKLEFEVATKEDQTKALKA
jgi:t-SNARE complex subunit (syntaxin)